MQTTGRTLLCPSVDTIILNALGSRCMMKTLGMAAINLYPTKTYWKGATLWTILFFFRFASRHHYDCDFQNRIRTCKTLLPFIMYFLCIGLIIILRKKNYQLHGTSRGLLPNGLYGVAPINCVCIFSSSEPVDPHVNPFNLLRLLATSHTSSLFFFTHVK